MLGGLDEFERHRDTGGPRSRSLRDPLAESDGGEGRLDRVGGAQVDPVLGWEVVERQRHIQVVADLRGRLGPRGAVVGGERFGGLDRQRLLRARVRGLRQRSWSSRLISF